MHTLSFAWLAVFFIIASPAVAAPDADAVLVIGALHDLHGREPDFDYAALREAIVAFDPDVLVLEVRPDELSKRGPTPGRPEYPAIIWPLIEEMAKDAVAMEPGGELFEQLAASAGRAIEAFRRADPAGAAAFAKLRIAVDELFQGRWTAPSQSQDKTTQAAVEAMREVEFSLVGEAFAKVQTEWDDYMTDQAKAAVSANPNKRVLILASFRNRHLIEAGLRETAPARLIDAAQWFDDGR